MNLAETLTLASGEHGTLLLQSASGFMSSSAKLG